MPRFLLFTQLPPELQINIWKLAFINGVCSYQGGLYLNSSSYPYEIKKAIGQQRALVPTHDIQSCDCHVGIKHPLHRHGHQIEIGVSVSLHTHARTFKGILISGTLGLRGLLRACYLARYVVRGTWEKMLKEALGQLKRDWERTIEKVWSPITSTWRLCDLENHENMERTETLLSIVNRLEKGFRRRA